MAFESAQAQDAILASLHRMTYSHANHTRGATPRKCGLVHDMNIDGGYTATPEEQDQQWGNSKGRTIYSDRATPPGAFASGQSTSRPRPSRSGRGLPFPTDAQQDGLRVRYTDKLIRVGRERAMGDWQRACTGEIDEAHLVYVHGASEEQQYVLNAQGYTVLGAYWMPGARKTQEQIQDDERCAAKADRLFEEYFDHDMYEAQN